MPVVKLFPRKSETKGRAGRFSAWSEQRAKAERLPWFPNAIPVYSKDKGNGITLHLHLVGVLMVKEGLIFLTNPNFGSVFLALELF
jgi:hypothetical protein